MTAVGLRITPVNATCDFMTAGRKTIFVNIGKEIPDTKSMKKAELEKTVQERIVTLGVVTMSHLGSEFLLSVTQSTERRFTRQECIAAVSLRVKEIAAMGATVDAGLLSPDGLKKKCRNFLRYCLETKILSEDGRGRYTVTLREPGTLRYPGFKAFPVRHSVNDLNSLLEWYA